MDMTLTQIESELENARSARLAGKEGLARVCARRAAGFAIRAYLSGIGVSTEGLSINDLLKSPIARSQLPENIFTQLDHLVTRVDNNYQLAAEIDLVKDAKEIIELLNNFEEKL
jgi:HEPN domain-containing protein